MLSRARGWSSKRPNVKINKEPTMSGGSINVSIPEQVIPPRPSIPLSFKNEFAPSSFVALGESTRGPFPSITGGSLLDGLDFKIKKGRQQKTLRRAKLVLD